MREWFIYLIAGACDDGDFTSNVWLIGGYMNIKFEYNVPEADETLIIRMDDIGPAMKISKERIEKMIAEGVDYMIRNQKDGSNVDYWFQYTGDTFIFIGWEDNDLLSIMVTTPRQRGEVILPSSKPD